MKRFVLIGAMALAAAAPAQAVETDVVLSGSFGGSLSFVDNDTGGEDLDIENNASSINLFASGQEAGYRAFVNYERGFDRYNSASQNREDQDFVREFFGGVSHLDYGTVSLGRQSTAYKLAGRRVDPFYDTSLAGFNGQFANEGASFGLSNLTNGFTSNSLAYTSPAFGKFAANAGVFLNDNGAAQGNDGNDVALGVAYNDDEAGYNAGLQILDSSGPVVFGFPAPGGTAFRAHGGYGADAWTLGASLEYLDLDGADDARKYLFVAGTYQILEKVKLAAAIGSTKDTPFDGEGLTGGAFYEVFKNFSAYGGLKFATLDSGDGVTFATGFNYYFEADLN